MTSAYRRHYHSLVVGLDTALFLDLDEVVKYGRAGIYVPEHVILRGSVAYLLFDELTGVLGLVYNRKTESLDDEIEKLIEARTQARKDRNWAEADRIRDELKAQGIVLEDTPQGVKWHRE